MLIFPYIITIIYKSYITISCGTSLWHSYFNHRNNHYWWFEKKKNNFEKLVDRFREMICENDQLVYFIRTSIAMCTANVILTNRM
jgi:hypothetical protein